MILHISTKDQKLVRVTLEDDNQVVQELSEENQFGSQVLLPLIDQILKNNNLEFKDLTEIKVDIGPGSFTGLRVGATVAQVLGLALNIPVNGKPDHSVELVYS